MALLHAQLITKQYAANGVLANAGASLAVDGGAIHAVIGENGAGKSTLMHVIAGVVTPDSGYVEMAGQRLSPGAPAASLEAGIVMSFQHPRLAASLAVIDNLVLGREPRTRTLLLDRGRARQLVLSAAPSLSPELLNRRVAGLSSGQARLVSVVSALLRLPSDTPGVLILDEPTEACTPDEVAEIYRVMRDTAAAGHGVVFISHKLPEVAEVADTVTVMRAGRDVATVEGHGEAGVLATLMTGEEPAAVVHVDAYHGHAAATEPAKVELKQVSAADRGRLLLDRVSFSVRSGEVLGFTGIRENGLEALERLLSGRLRPDSGILLVDGRPLTRFSELSMRKSGLRYVPSDRFGRGASLESTISENVIPLMRRTFSRLGIFIRQRIREFAVRLLAATGVDSDPAAPMRTLSGGTVQKVILGREVDGEPQLLVVCEPGTGLDAQSRELFYERIEQTATSGAAVIVISADIEEVLTLTRRVGVFFAGRCVFPAERDLTLPSIGRIMAGADTHSAAKTGEQADA